MTDTKLFTEDRRVVQVLKDMTDKCGGKQYSDLIDADGNQYVDLVMEGGGVLGIALTGYTYMLEKAGIRFLGIGGTSAGAINALMIAARGTPAEAKSEKLVSVLTSIPMASFIDGDDDAKDFSQAVLNKASFTKLLWKGFQVIDNLTDHLGLNPGKKFFDWLTEELKQADVRTNLDLLRKLAVSPRGLRHRHGGNLSDSDKCGRLAMIAADITTETKVEFPKMAELYWDDPDGVNPACFARASMSIPFFFHPFQARNCPQDRAAAWEKHAGYYGAAPKNVKFMDGGIMSNFPINLFHEPNRVPTAPTFGAKIGVDRAGPIEIKKPAQLLGAVFDTARHTLDFDFIVQNPDYRHLVTMIDTGTHNWLNFSLDDKDKVDLFARGAVAASKFLCGFDWAKYKEIRKGIAEAASAART